jgi:hypothetical protein
LAKGKSHNKIRLAITELKNATATTRERRKPEFGIKDIHKMKSKTTNVIKLQKGSLAVGDKVKTSTKRFGKEYAIGKPEYTYGIIVKKIKGNLASILWEGEKRGMNSKVSHLIRIPGNSIMMIAEDGENFAVPTYEIADEEASHQRDEKDLHGQSEILMMNHNSIHTYFHTKHSTKQKEFFGH